MFGLGRSAPQVMVVNASRVSPELDPDAVVAALIVRDEAGRTQTAALEVFRAAERAYDAAVAKAYTEASGPAHQLKHLAELATAAEREERDEAEVIYRAAEQDVRIAELAWRAAMAGVVPDGES